MLALHGTHVPFMNSPIYLAGGPTLHEGSFFIWGETDSCGGASRAGFFIYPHQADETRLESSIEALIQMTAGFGNNRPSPGSAFGIADDPLGIVTSSEIGLAAAFLSSADTISSEELSKAISNHPAIAKLSESGNRLGIADFPDLEEGLYSFNPLKPWLINGIWLPPAKALLLLSMIPESNLLPGDIGFRLGSDLAFWSKAAKLGLEFLVRGRFAPGLAKVPPKRASARESFKAMWVIVPDEGKDLERLKALGDAMPEAVRTFMRSKDFSRLEKSDDIPPFPSGRNLVVEFLNAAIDGLVPSLAENEDYPVPNHPIARKWLKALFNEDDRKIPVSGATREELDAFYDGVALWLAPAFKSQSSTAFRTCFRLEPPDVGITQDAASAQGVKPTRKVESAQEAETSGKKGRVNPSQVWTLRFLLQATDDPSLLVPASQVWKESRRVLEFLNRTFENPQERLLCDLGKASKIFPKIEESLKSPRPEACLLSTEEAYAFLKEAAGPLEESGFGIIVPAWWNGTRVAGPRLGLRLSLKAPVGSKTSSKDGGGPGSGLVGLNSIVQYDWQIALGDETISKEEFMKLAELKTPLINIRGKWVELEADAVERFLSLFAKDKDGGNMSLGKALSLGLASDEAAASAEAIPGTGLPVVGIDAQGSVREFIEKLKLGERLEELPQPDGLKGKLRPYQVRGYSWLSFLRNHRIGACLADDMGLGKTIQIISLLLRDKEGGRHRKPVLLICPTSLVGNWQRELSRFAPSIKVMVHHGARRLAGEDLQKEAAGSDLVISTYSLARRDEEDLARIDWEGVILDEAQNIKNPSAQQTQSIRKLPAGFRVALTGTPVENRLSELWSIMEFLNPGYLGAHTSFKERFAIPIERYGDQDATALLRRLVGPFLLRRLKTDPNIVQDLPEKQEMKVYCNLTREQATLYEAVVQEMMRKIEEASGIERKGVVLAALTRLKQVANHPVLFLEDNSALEGRSGKLMRLREMLEEILDLGERALIFTQFTRMGSMLKDYLEAVFGRKVLFLHGGVDRKLRDRMVERFQNDPDAPFAFVMSLKAGGVGLNLTRASHVFHFDRWWNPAVENQATDRAFRIGQSRTVQVHKFICAGTLEEKIDELIESKKALAENVIGAGESWITEMSTDQLRELFALDQDAISE